MWAKISIGIVGLLLVGVLIAVAGGNLFGRVIRKLQPPDPYQLAEHYAEETALAAELRQAPEDPALWLRAAAFEVRDNAPYGAAFCLTEAQHYGATAADCAPVAAEIKTATGRFTTLYNAFLLTDRFSDGKNDYADIYPVIARLRGDDTGTQLTGKARADYDLLEAHLLLREGRRTEARTLFAALQEQPGPLQGLATYLYAKTWLNESDLQPARQGFQAYLAGFPGERLNAFALLELGDLALQGGDPASAETFFRSVMTQFPESPQAHAALLATLDITFGVVPKNAPDATEVAPDETLFDLGAEPAQDLSEPKDGPTAAPVTPATETPIAPPPPTTPGKAGLNPLLIPDDADGWKLYGDLFNAAPDTIEVQRRAIALYNAILVPEPEPLKIWTVLTPASALGWARCLAAAGYVRGALELCDWGVAQAGFAKERAELGQLRGRLLIGQGKLAEARQGLEPLRNQLAPATDVGILNYELARTWRLGRDAGRARPLYLKAATTKDPVLAADAAAQAAWAAAQRSDWETALTEYGQIVKKYPTSVYADIGREHLLSRALGKGDTATARTLAEDLVQTAHKGGRFLKGLYFKNTLSGLSTAEWATFQQRYPFTAYGTYVARTQHTSIADFNLDSAATDLDFATLRQQERSLAGAAWAAGLWDIAGAEWEAQPEATTFEPFRAFAETLLIVSRSNPKDTILETQEFFDRGGQAGIAPGWTRLLIEASYPLDYLAEAEVEAERYQVPAPLILGIIRQESFFNPKAKSGAGARGLMQLMPPTATWAAKQTGLGKVGPAEIETPATNLRLATWHLDFLRTQVGGSFGLMLAAHNGGPGNLAKWRERIAVDASQEELFTELIPNQETREFVKLVLANQTVYTWRLAQHGHEVVF